MAKRKLDDKDDKQFLISRLRIFLKWRNVPAATWLRAALYYGHLTGQIDMVFKEREETSGAPPETAPHETAFDSAADDWIKQAREMARRTHGLPDGKPSSR